jgi:hypothetical protein
MAGLYGICFKGEVMKKRYIVGLLICCLLVAFFSVGCTEKTATPTTTVKTPLQNLSDSADLRFNAVALIDTRQDADILALANRITTEIASITGVDLGPLTARVSILEALNISDITASVSYQGIRVSALEALNISYRLTALEALHGGNVSTPTPTPVSNCSLVKKPVAIYPTNGNMSMPNTSIMFQWVECNASGYKFYFGTDPASLTEIAILEKDVLAYPFPAPSPDTYYFWRVISLSPCGNQSTMWWFKTQ